MKRARSTGPALVRPPGEPMPNARLFLGHEYEHNDQLLLIHQGGQFYRWNGTCWPAVEDPILRANLYRWFENKLYASDKGELKSFAPTARKIADLMDTTRAITIIETATPTPSWLDGGEHPADEMVACRNGLLHVPSLTLHHHRPSFYIHHSVPFAFDPEAPKPEKWLAFLDGLWEGDVETIGALQEVFGYLVSGDTRQQKIFLLVGPKRGGKGTIARVLTRMLGRHNVAGPTLASLGTNFGLQGLIGKPAAVISDARIGPKTDATLVAERLLSVSGEDLLNVDRKYLTPWSGYLPTRFVILTNELPRFTDSSGALASRFVVLMLHRSFYGRENPALTDELCQELPGIFNWSLDGLQRLRARGRFLQPQASADAIQALEDLASPIGAFLRDRCTIGPGKTVEIDALYNIYREWCGDNGRTPLNKTLFGRDLRSALPELRVSQIGAERRRHYISIAPVSSVSDTTDTDTSDSRSSRVTIHCGADEDGDDLGSVKNDKQCPACGGDGCPWCKPEQHGLPPRRGGTVKRASVPHP